MKLFKLLRLLSAIKFMLVTLYILFNLLFQYLLHCFILGFVIFRIKDLVFRFHTLLRRLLYYVLDG